MIIRFAKGQGRPDSMACLRDGGATDSATWQRSSAAMVEHDLVHYAVETTLGLRHAFYGPVARGANIADFEVAKARRRVEIEGDASETEFIVGFLQTELRSGEPVADFQKTLRDALAARGAKPAIELDDAFLSLIRERIAILLERWRALPPGESLELPFDEKSPAWPDELGG